MTVWLLWTVRAMAGAVAIGAAALGVRDFQEHYREQGRIEVRQQWISAENARQIKERSALISQQQGARMKPDEWMSGMEE